MGVIFHPTYIREGIINSILTFLELSEVENIREGIEQLEQQTKERMERIAKLLTEPIFDENQLKI